MAERCGLQPIVHRCPRNYEGSSKGMEAKGTLALVEGIHDSGNNCFVETAVTDDDTSIRGILKHSYAELLDAGVFESKKADWPRNERGTYLKDYGKIPLGMPQVENFLADKAHRKKSLGTGLYKVKRANPKLKISNTDCERIKTSFGYGMGACNENGKTFEQFSEDMKAVLLHHFNDHSYCGDFCRFREPATTEEEREYRRKRFRVKGSAIYEKFEEVLNRFTTPKMLRQVYHSFSTQKNEALNKAMTAVAPKDKTFSMTAALQDRVNYVVVKLTCGMMYLVETVLSLNMMMVTEATREYLQRNDRRVRYIRRHVSKPEFRHARAEKKKAAMRQQLREEVHDEKLGYVYEAAVAVLGDDNGGDGAASAGGGAVEATVVDGGTTTADGGTTVADGGTTAADGGTTQQFTCQQSAVARKPPCKWCKSLTHQRKSHKDCPFNDANKMD